MTVAALGAVLLAAAPLNDLPTLAVGTWGFCAIEPGGALRCKTAWISAALPTERPVPEGVFRSVIAAGGDAFCALRDDGAIACWPGGPRMIWQGLSFPGRYSALARGQGYRGFACALSVDRALDCAAVPISGEPATVAARLADGPFDALQASGPNVCALGDRGATCAVQRCRSNDPKTCRLEPVSFPGAFVQFTSGDGFGCGQRADGVLVCFRDDGTPTGALLTGGPFQRLFSHGPELCGLTDAGFVSCKPKVPGADGELSSAYVQGVAPHLAGVRRDGTAELPEPWASELPEGARFIELAGADPFCGRRPDGGMLCVGNFRLDEQKLAQVERAGIDRLVASENDFCAVAGSESTCWGSGPSRSPLPAAIASDGAFGARPYRGQRQHCERLDGGAVTCDVAKAPAGPFVEVQSGNDFSCGRRANDTLQCWGTIVGRPVSTPKGRFKALALGGVHACAIDAGGALKCWGNEAGRPSLAPRGKFTALFTGYLDTCARRVDGAVLCWGDSFGALLQLPIEKPAHVAVGRSGACAVAAGGRVGCWGQLRW